MPSGKGNGTKGGGGEVSTGRADGLTEKLQIFHLQFFLGRADGLTEKLQIFHLQFFLQNFTLMRQF